MKDQVSLQWAQNLRRALQDWCKANGYEPWSRISDDLGITPRVWDSFRHGQAVVERADDTLYARIFLWTGLAEADPRSIPPRRYKGITETLTIRAWEPRRFQNWLKSKEAQELIAERQRKFPSVFTEPSFPASYEETETTSIPPVGPSSTAGMFVGAWIDALVNLLGDQLARRIAPEIERIFDQKFAEVLRSPEEIFSSQIREPKPKTAPDDIGSLTQALLNALQPYVDGTPGKRDQLKTKYGRELALIAALTNILTQPKNERESSLMTFRGQVSNDH